MGYDLFYVEFDDQGLVHPSDEEPRGDASKQLHYLTDDVLRNRYAHDFVNLIVYVHGWKHDVQTSDKDVNEFRKLMRSEALLEASNVDPHKVVGIFVGWRGLVTWVEPFKELSFWDRKSTALKVAEGSARDLFSHLEQYEEERNAGCVQQQEPDGRPLFRCPQSSAGMPRPPVRMLIIGHSFGAQIVFASLSPYLLASLTDDSDRLGGNVHRYGDLVILVSPAFEATGFVPLFEEAKRQVRNHYQAPILVSITSKSDWATRIGFRIGRYASTLFQTYSSPTERHADLNTIGWVDELVTHDLLSNPEASRRACNNWKKQPDNAAALKSDLDIEGKAAEDFFKRFPGGNERPNLTDGWTRIFCGGTELKLRKGVAANSPIWNVFTYKPIIPGHSDIETDELETFIRQVYRDSILYPGHGL